MRKTTKVGLSATAVLALSAGLVGTAHADYAPKSGDVVGVGSDTVQNIQDFIDDGDTHSDPGFNTATSVHRVVSFDATPDGNDRAGYLNGSANGALKPLNPTVTLLAGTSPIVRPNGSGAGLAAIEADVANSTNEIQFVRTSSKPGSGDFSAMTNAGGLRFVRIADDPLGMVRLAGSSPASNATVGLSRAQLNKILTVDTHSAWSSYGGTSSDNIIILLPQSGSGTRKTFLTDVTGSATPTITNADVQTVEENDPAALTSLSAAQKVDAIEPFSGGRKNLYDGWTSPDGAVGQYFKDPTVVYPGASTFLSSGVEFLPGTSQTASDTGGSSVYSDLRGLYINFRQNDATSTTPYQAGSSLNWAQKLFIGSSPYVASGAATALIESGGAVQDYKDCGLNNANGC